MNPKGITLWNPYAFAMVAKYNGVPLKTVETRSWETPYRGPICIHAALNKSSIAAAKKWGINLPVEYLKLLNIPRNLEAFRNAGNRSWDDLPFGMILGVGNLIACIPTHDNMGDTKRRMINVLGREQWESDQHWGNFAPRRYLWHIEEMDVFPTPIPYRGSQGIYNVEGITV